MIANTKVKNIIVKALYNTITYPIGVEKITDRKKITGKT